MSVFSQSRVRSGDAFAPPQPPPRWETVLPRSVWSRAEIFKEETGKKDQWVFARNYDVTAPLHNLPLSSPSWAGSQGIQVRNDMIATTWDDGKRLHVTKINAQGALSKNSPCIRVGSKVLDFQFSPFSPTTIVSGSEDGHLRLWDVPEQGLQQDITTPRTSMKGEGRLRSIRFHPRAAGVLSVAGTKNVVQVFDTELGVSPISLPHPDTVWDMAWTVAGSVLGTTCKDKQIRMYDVRSNATPIATVLGHGSTKCSLISWLDGTVVADAHTLFTLGFSRANERQLIVWDRRNLSGCLSIGIVDKNQVGTPLCRYDEETSLIVIGTRGDPVLKFCEVNESRDTITYLNEYKSKEAAKGIALDQLTDSWQTSDLPSLFSLHNKSIELFKLSRSMVLHRSILERRMRERTNTQIARQEASKQAKLLKKRQLSVASHSAAEWFQGTGRFSIAKQFPAMSEPKGTAPDLPSVAELSDPARAASPVSPVPSDSTRLEQRLLDVLSALQEPSEQKDLISKLKKKQKLNKMLGDEVDETQRAASPQHLQVVDVPLVIDQLSRLYESVIGGPLLQRGATSFAESHGKDSGHQAQQLAHMQEHIKELEKSIVVSKKEMAKTQKKMTQLEKKNEKLKASLHKKGGHSRAPSARPEPEVEVTKVYETSLPQRFSSGLSFEQLHMFVYFDAAWHDL